MLHVELTNEDIRNSKAYKEYYAVASRAAPPKTKASVRKIKSSFDTTITPLTAAGTKLSTSAKGRQPAKASKTKSPTVLFESSSNTTVTPHPTAATGTKFFTSDEGTGIIPVVPDVPTEESNEEISWKSNDEDDDDVDERSDDQDNDDDQDDDDQDDDDQDEEEETKEEESFDPIVQTPENSNDEDVNINLEGRDVQMTDVHTIQEFEDTHVSLTSVNPDGQQHSSSVSSQFVTSMLNPSPDVEIDSLFETTNQMNVSASTTVASLTLTAPTLPPPTIPTSSQTLEVNFSEFVQTNQFAGAVSFIPEIVQRYMDQRMNEAVKEQVKEQVKEHVKVQVSKILAKIEKTVTEQLEAKVLTRSYNSSKTSYAVADDLSEMKLKKIIIEKMESNKSIHQFDEQRNLYKDLFEAYESDMIILDTYGDTIMLKRRRDDAGKDEEPSAGSDRGSKRRREGKEPELKSTPKEKATKTTGKSTQGSKSQQKTASESAPAEAPMQTTQDLEEPSHQEFEIDTLNPELLAGPTYKLMKGSCKSLVELEFFLEEPLPLIPNSRGLRVIPFDHFINNDLEYLRGGASSRKYTTSVTKTKVADYGHIKWIEDLVPRTMWSQDPGIQMKYLPQAIWRKSDKERAAAMIQAIDKQLKTRRIMRSLKKFIGGRLYKGDFRMLQWTI
nr:hypothetical protein [Tanacetum cinerariifolium]